MLNYLKHALLLHSLVTFAVHASETEDLFPTPSSTSLSSSSILTQSDEEILSETNWQLYKETKNDQFLWDAFMLGHPTAMETTLKSNVFQKYINILNTQLILKAMEGNHHAQALLIDCYLHNRHGFVTTPRNQKAILSLLREFAKTNPMAQVQLIQAYIDGDFGINPKKATQVKRGKHLALQYIDTPGIGDLIIWAMKENRLGFKSRRSYLHRYKDRKTNKWVKTTRNLDLPVIKKLAFRQNNKSAQTFLLECFIDNKYGADSLNTNAFRKVVRALEPLAYNNPELAALIVLVWDQNLLAIKDPRYLNQEKLRINTEFNPQYTNHKSRNENSFALLQDLIETDD